MRQMTKKILAIEISIIFMMLTACQTVAPVAENEPVPVKEIVDDIPKTNGSAKSASPMKGVVEIRGYLRLTKQKNQTFILISDNNIEYHLVLSIFKQLDELMDRVDKRIYIKGLLEVVMEPSGSKNQIMIQDIQDD